MYKVSQEIRLNTTNGTNHMTGNASGGGHNSSSPEASNDICIFGKYQRTPDADAYPTENPHVFIAPELTDASKVQLLHFPSGALRLNSEVDFIIKRNGVRGNFEVKLESPNGILSAIPLDVLDPERFQVKFQVIEAGLYKVHIKCNSVELPKSPYIIVAVSGGETLARTPSEPSQEIILPNFLSDATRVIARGLGLTQIHLHANNDFTVDGTAAGNNILFVGILGPQGQCDEVVIRHLGRLIYGVTYRVQDAGHYLLAVKWGEDHIPGSPFSLCALPDLSTN